MTTPMRELARQVLTTEGFAVETDGAARAEIERATATDAVKLAADDANIRDLRELPWSSIDNKETRDVDQIEQSEQVADGTLVRVAIADVDAYVSKGSSLDRRAAQNTVSVYGGDVLLAMLPEELSEGVTSLLADQDRLAIVAEFVVSGDGSVTKPLVYRALVRNRAQLDYVSLGSWMSGDGALPPAARGLEDQLRMQQDAANRLHQQRDRLGALEFARRETRPVMRNGAVVDIEVTDRGPARDLIEDFMIAANSVIAGYLEQNNVSWVRRMVGAPERWPKIVEIAAHAGVTLPATPDRHALGAFLRAQREKNPKSFGDLSLSVLRLLGSGSYVVEHKCEELEAHFALGVDDYTHFTAPNRRYADIVTQRIVKAVLEHAPVPYSDAELEAIAKQCTEMEDKAKGVERKISKLAAVELMRDHIGELFEATIAASRGRGEVALIHSPAVEVHLSNDAAADGAHSRHRPPGSHVRVRITRVDEEHGDVDGEVVHQ